MPTNTKILHIFSIYIILSPFIFIHLSILLSVFTCHHQSFSLSHAHTFLMSIINKISRASLSHSVSRVSPLDFIFPSQPSHARKLNILSPSHTINFSLFYKHPQIFCTHTSYTPTHTHCSSLVSFQTSSFPPHHHHNTIASAFSALSFPLQVFPFISRF